jgi:hypothetical protein
MNTQYIIRTTIAVPTTHIDDANQLALVLGESPADDETFGEPQWQDEQGNLYSACSTVAKQVFFDNASQPLQPPSFAPHADIEAATRAQALLQINDGPARPDRIAAIVGDRLESAMDHVAALGLTRIEAEYE